MKIGVKTYKDKFFLEHFKNKSDFFEIQAIQGVDYSFLEEFKEIPIVIHAEHQGFGINYADKTKKQKNIDSLNFAIKLADKYNSKKIIVHPGEIDNKNCSIENSKDLLKSFKDNRILVENMPLYKNKIRICSTPQEIKDFLKITKKGFCLDINHAIQRALSLKIDYIKFLEELIKLKPSHYHIGGQKMNEEDDAHKSFLESELDLRKVISILPKDAEITLETNPDIEKTEYDLKIIRKIIKEINK